MSDVFGDEEVYSDNLDEVYFDEYDNEGDFVEDNKLIRRALSLTNSRKVCSKETNSDGHNAVHDCCGGGIE